MSKGQWIFIGLATVAMVSCIANGQADADRRAAEVAKVEAQKSPEQKLAEQKEKKKKEDDFQRVVSYAMLLKKQMKNPDSFSLTSATLMNDGSICYEYRATNSFNAVVPDILVVRETTASKKSSDWNKFCAAKTGTDYTHVKHAL